MKTIALLVATAVASLAAAVAVPAQPPSARPARELIEIGQAPTLGPADAPVTIVDFSDFQCPYCARGSRTIRRLVAEYEGRVRWVFKHLPLKGHADAPLAHEAALAAAAQGRFWDMHRTLMRRQEHLKRDDLVQYARDLELDAEAFAEALRHRSFRGQVLRDMFEARRLRVNVTPTYFINGLRVIGARDIGFFRDVIDRELAAAGGAPPGAAPPTSAAN